MITYLNTVIPEKKKGLRGIVDRLRRDRVSSQVKSARGVSVRELTYTCYSGTLRLDRLDAYVWKERRRLLCTEDTVFPPGCGYSRFEDTEFRERLCVNMAVSALRLLRDPRVRVTLYDPGCKSGDSVLSLLKYTSDLAVVTSCPEEYRVYSELALDELGAAFPVTKRTELLADRDLIIAPCRVETALPVKSGATALFSERPASFPGGCCCYDYQVRLPAGFESIKPAPLDNAYFCAALYSIAGQFELGSIEPLSCSNGSTAHTAASLAQALGESISARAKRE